MKADLNAVRLMVLELQKASTPAEAIAALFPSSQKVGEIVLRPLTLLSLGLASKLGANIERGLSSIGLSDMMIVAFVSKLTDDGILAISQLDKAEAVAALSEWAASIKPTEIKALWQAVDKLIQEAFSTMVSPEQSQNPLPAQRPASAL